MKRHIAMLLVCCCTLLGAQTTSYKFDFSGKKKAKEGYILVTPETLYTPERGYGYDFVGQQSTDNSQFTIHNSAAQREQSQACLSYAEPARNLDTKYHNSQLTIDN